MNLLCCSWVNRHSLSSGSSSSRVPLSAEWNSGYARMTTCSPGLTFTVRDLIDTFLSLEWETARHVKNENWWEKNIQYIDIWKQIVIWYLLFNQLCILKTCIKVSFYLVLKKPFGLLMATCKYSTFFWEEELNGGLIRNANSWPGPKTPAFSGSTFLPDPSTW